MLVLSRKQNQEILIGDEIKITVLKSKGNTVRLGIEAPPHIRIARGELPPLNDKEETRIENVTVVFSDQVEEPARSSERFRVVDENRRQPIASDRQSRIPLPGLSGDNRLKKIISEITR